MLSDIEINQNANKKSILEISKKLNISDEDVVTYGKDFAKVDVTNKGNKDGKLILVTAISPTPAGEGKSTTTIGLVDGLNKLGYEACGCLREPSMGPVFGKKGGATGGGYSQIVPMEDINLHFTGDMHAITSANNLICSYLDNHIFQGNSLNINENNISIKRALDVNDRTLREITIAQKKKVNGVERGDSFNITVASELMAILCLSNDLDDLRRRVSKMVVAYDYNNNEITVNDLDIVGSICVILKDAIKPNLVQTIENNPVFVHGGPFANIAHGCNSIIATKYALSKCDYVVTEAGFGSDLGSEKFIDIKCRNASIAPNLIVVVATIRSLKMHGGQKIDELELENVANLSKGFANLKRHLEICSLYNTNIIVCINKFSHDTNDELSTLVKLIEQLNFKVVINDSFARGSIGSQAFSQLVINELKEDVKLSYVYDLKDSYIEKINKVCKKVYHAKDVYLNQVVKDKIDEYIRNGHDNLAICIAKTPNSFTGNSNLLGAPSDFTIEITDVSLSAGAEFLVVYVGGILTMPGLPASPAAKSIDIINGKIVGLS